MDEGISLHFGGWGLYSVSRNVVWNTHITVATANVHYPSNNYAHIHYLISISIQQASMNIKTCIFFFFFHGGIRWYISGSCTLSYHTSFRYRYLKTFWFEVILLFSKENDIYFRESSTHGYTKYVYTIQPSSGSITASMLLLRRIPELNRYSLFILAMASSIAVFSDFMILWTCLLVSISATPQTVHSVWIKRARRSNVKGYHDHENCWLWWANA